MWILECSKEPKIKWEHHTEEGAFEHFQVHLLGSQFYIDNYDWDDSFIVLPPCDGDHKIFDNGEPCYQRNCQTRYVR